MRQGSAVPPTRSSVTSRVERPPISKSFHGILYPTSEDRPAAEQQQAPDCFTDLNLDQVVDTVVAAREEYDLKPFFHAPLTSPTVVTYRHEILRDLESSALLTCVTEFAQGMRKMRASLAQARKLRETYQKESWFLDSVAIYCGIASSLARGLTQADLRSRGFLAFRDYVAAYVSSASFAVLWAETQTLRDDLSRVRYSLQIRGNHVKVSRYDAETDYSAEVLETFEKFKQDAATERLVEYSNTPDMDHVEARILQLVAKLHPETFLALDRYRDQHDAYLDRTLADFDREVQFYLAYLEYLSPLKAGRLPFCYPRVSDSSKEVHASQTFDLALAHKLVLEKSTVVCNDFSLSGQERVFVVSGPNQGGKTSFARTFGQLHYLASLGFPVPGDEAQLFLYDRLFTHFEKQEDLGNLNGKLQDDLVRIHRILEQATADSVVILNEIFTSTTLDDALSLGTKVLERIIALGPLCVCVTFVDELSTLGESTVSLVSTVVPDNPAVRTYKIVRKPADGLAYSAAIAEKYRLTYESLKRRIAS